MLHSYISYFKRNKDSFLEDFFTFLHFPSVSTDSDYRNDLLACADWLGSYMQSIGLDTHIWETSGAPILFGSSPCHTGPTLLFYGHYDVQPPDPLEEWLTPPFEPEIRNGAVYARGASDNKGQIFYTLLAIRSFLEIAKQTDIQIKVLIEGEEEIGSPGLQTILEEKRSDLQADHVLIVDIDMYARHMPAITLGSRGVLNINVTVKNSTFDLHSGGYGGVVWNPANALIKTLGMAWDTNGNVVIPEFYQNILPLSEEEKKQLDWEGDPEQEASLLGIKACLKEDPFSPLESNWIRPTLEVNGIESGYTGKGVKTIIPSKAMVKLSCRLVPGQHPDAVFALIKSFFKQHLPNKMDVLIENKGAACPCMTSPTSKTAQLVAQAYERVYHVRCRRKLCGGTIPIAASLAKVCEGELVMIGVALRTDHAHAPNESFALDRFKEGFLSITQILEIVANGEKNGVEGSGF